ncbi:DUF6968 family protein [Actinomadura gamaensis]|uniref:DUF6968 family protein n=1 Tax=Actinomadura gamaensis TaxID=1763541 RepID=A0ABV9U0Z7_9ACTN
MELAATRTLLLDERGNRSEVTVLLGRPQRDEHGDFACPVEITGLGEEHRYTSHGVDGIQALQLALETAGAALDAFDRPGASLTWNGEPDLGFLF